MNATLEDDTAKAMAWDTRVRPVFYYLSLSISIVGLAGKALCVKVMGEVQRTVKGVRLIKYIAIVDILVLVSAQLIIIPWNMTTFSQTTPDLTRVLNCVAFVLASVFFIIYMFEVYLTVLIAVQRCLALAMPFKFKRIMRATVVNKILLSLLVFSVLFNISHWIAIRAQFNWDNDLNVTLILTGDNNGILSEDVEYYWLMAQLIFNYSVPLVVLVVWSIIFVISRQRMTTIRPCTDRMNAHKMTTIVMTITIMSAVVHFLNVATFVASEFKFKVSGGSYNQVPTFLAILYTSNVMVCANSSVNFIFYCTLGREFRRTLSAMFRRRQPNPQPQRNVIELIEMSNKAREV